MLLSLLLLFPPPLSSPSPSSSQKASGVNVSLSGNSAFRIQFLDHSFMQELEKTKSQ